MAMNSAQCVAHLSLPAGMGVRIIIVVNSGTSQWLAVFRINFANGDGPVGGLPDIVTLENMFPFR